MMQFEYSIGERANRAVGAVVLQSDETLEQDFRRMIPGELDLYVTRIPSAEDLSPAAIDEMGRHLTASASLLPRGRAFEAVAYGCTSASAQLGLDRVTELVQAGVPAATVTNPASALIAACRALGITRLGLLSPYIPEISARLRGALSEHGIETPAFGDFSEPSEAAVARIDAASVANATKALAAGGGLEGLFISCTNIQALDLIAPLEAETGLPVLSSNLVLGWHLCRAAGLRPLAPAGVRLFSV